MRSIVLLSLGLLCATSCAHAAAAPDVPVAATPASNPVPASGPDTAAVSALIAATAPSQPLQVTFDWTMQDRDFKFSGRGVVRMEGGYRARLDLFGLQDIQLLRAALLDDSLALVYSGPRVPIPPVAFLWATMGVARHPAHLLPATVKRDGGALDYTYDDASGRWRFRADSGSLKSVEWVGPDGGRRTIELTGPFRFGRPSKASYRDWREFRELSFTITAVDVVAPFDPGIWNVSIR